MNRLFNQTEAEKRQFDAFCQWKRSQNLSAFSTSVTKSAMHGDACLNAEKGRAEYLESRLEYVNRNLADNKVS